jgi:hypothetical protein
MTNAQGIPAQFERYFECWGCGRVFDDPAGARAVLARWVSQSPDPTRQKTCCPKCRTGANASPFPPLVLRPIFENTQACYVAGQGILVLVLTQAATEGMFNYFRWTLIDRLRCPEEVCEAIEASLLSWGAFDSFMEGLTGDTVGTLCKGVGYGGLLARLQDIRRHRNTYLHKGIMKSELLQADIDEAVGACSGSIDMFAALHTKFCTDHPMFALPDPYDPW